MATIPQQPSENDPDMAIWREAAMQKLLAAYADEDAIYDEFN